MSSVSPAPGGPCHPCATTAVTARQRDSSGAGLAPNCFLGVTPRPWGTAGCWALAGSELGLGAGTHHSLVL